MGILVPFEGVNVGIFVSRRVGSCVGLLGRAVFGLLGDAVPVSVIGAVENLYERRLII